MRRFFASLKKQETGFPKEMQFTTFIAPKRRQENVTSSADFFQISRPSANVRPLQQKQKNGNTKVFVDKYEELRV
jgi:hypothetical protein